VRDVVPWADRTLRTVPDARHRALVGISDGGDAAVLLVMRHPDTFAGGAGLSGRYRPHDPGGYEAVVGPPGVRERVLRRCSALEFPAETLARERGIALWFDAGALDPVAGDCRALDHRLDSLGVRHQAHVYFGWHDWPFWRRRMAVALPWLARELGWESPAAR
jgi:S-formylglutathione hydrolase FrmB